MLFVELGVSVLQGQILASLLGFIVPIVHCPLALFGAVLHGGHYGGEGSARLGLQPPFGHRDRIGRGVAAAAVEGVLVHLDSRVSHLVLPFRRQRRFAAGRQCGRELDGAGVGGCGEEVS